MEPEDSSLQLTALPERLGTAAGCLMQALSPARARRRQAGGCWASTEGLNSPHQPQAAHPAPAPLLPHQQVGACRQAKPRLLVL